MANNIHFKTVVLLFNHLFHIQLLRPIFTHFTYKYVFSVTTTIYTVFMAHIQLFYIHVCILITALVAHHIHFILYKTYESKATVVLYSSPSG